MKSCADIYRPQRMSPNDCGDPLIFLPAPLQSRPLWFASEIAQRLLDGLSGVRFLNHHDPVRILMQMDSLLILMHVDLMKYHISLRFTKSPVLIGKLLTLGNNLPKFICQKNAQKPQLCVVFCCVSEINSTKTP